MNEDDLLLWLASVSDDPVAFVMGAFEWGVGPLAKWSSFEEAIESWQMRLLEAVRDGLLNVSQAIKLATASGHGVGKSACCSWLILWAISTATDTRGVVTANTEAQLKTKTWAELGKWYSLFIAKSLFKLTPTALYSSDKERERTWRIDLIPWSERNTEAFAGLHNQGRRILVVFDEASAIVDTIWEVAEGALTDSDTQIIWAVFGNPTRNSGRFKSCFDDDSGWFQTRVDSREVSFTNKAQISLWLKTYGDDSDFARIRIKGEFPRTGEMEFFSAEAIDAAMEREPEGGIGALALGVDVARFGANFSVIFPRRGRDAVTIPRRKFQGISTVELAGEVSKANRELKADGIMIDEGGVGGGVVDQVRHMQLHCFGVQFGGKPTGFSETGTFGESYANKRAEMYGSLRAWIKGGSLPPDPELRAQLLSITYTFNNRDQIQLTSKEVMMREGKPSPDDVDALACTFAFPLEAKKVRHGGYDVPDNTDHGEYHPFAALGGSESSGNSRMFDYNPYEAVQ
jgi:hypothetical protein